MLKKIILLSALTFLFSPKVFSQCSNVTDGGTITLTNPSCSNSGYLYFVNVTYPSGGSGTLQYQWQSSSNNVSWYNLYGATTAAYTMSAPSSSNYIRRTAKMSGCTTYDGISNTIYHYVFVPTMTPTSSSTVCSGTSVVFNTPQVAGYTYNWTRNGSYIFGATNSSYNATQAGSYNVIVNNGSCSSSIQYGVNVYVQQPLVTTITSSTFVGYCSITPVAIEGHPTTPSGYGPAPYTYQWKESGSLIPNETTEHLAVTHNGTYTFSATNSCGTFTSANYVVNSPMLTANPLGLIAPSGTVAICAGGIIPLYVTDSVDFVRNKYKWYKDGVLISGSSSANYHASAAGEYCCSSKDYCGDYVTSNRVIITTGGTGSPPTGTLTGPSTVCSNGQVLFTATNSGPYPGFQWKRNGVDISGATDSHYIASTAGTYVCNISNNCGVISPSIVLTASFTGNTVITSPATGPDFCTGGNVTLTCNTAGAQSYQWYQNYNLISGATSSSYTTNQAANVICKIAYSGCTDIAQVNVFEATGIPHAYIKRFNLQYDTIFQCYGNQANQFYMQQTGGQPYAFQWYKDGAPYGAPGHIFVFGGWYYNVPDGHFYCKLTNACGTAFSDTVYLSSDWTLPDSDVPNIGMCPGDTINLNLNVPHANHYVLYSWYLPNDTTMDAQVQIPYQTNSTSYILHRVAFNECDESDQQIYVNHEYTPQVSIQATGATTLCSGGGVNLYCTSCYNSPYLQWKKNGINISGATLSTYVATSTGAYTLTGSGNCTSTTSNSIAVNIITGPPAATASAPYTSICSNGATTVYVSAATGNTYQWKFNGTNISGATLSYYNVTTVGDYSCFVTNQCGFSALSNTITITLQNAPNMPGNISGITHPCAGTSSGYSIATVPTALNYTWEVPANASIASGQGTTSIVVNFSSSFTGGYIKVAANNACGTGVQKQKGVQPNSPAIPGTITGLKTGVCGLTLSYSIAAVSGASSYLWSVPAGVTINSGQGTTSINITFTSSFSSGSISVSSTNSCGNSAPKTITVTGATAKPGVITGPATVCANQTGVVFSISPVANATSYTWSTVGGGTIISGQGGTSVVVNYGSNTNGIKVSAVNSCGASSYRSKGVSVTCRQESGEAVSLGVSVFPNPSSGIFYLNTPSGEEKNYIIQVADVTGRVLEEYKNISAGTQLSFGENLSSGFYFARVMDADRTEIIKLIKEK